MPISSLVGKVIVGCKATGFTANSRPARIQLHALSLINRAQPNSVKLTQNRPTWEIRLCIGKQRHHFYQRDAMLERVFATATCPSVRPSRAGIMSKRRKLASWFLYYLVAPRFSFSGAKFHHKIRKRSLRAGASNKGGVGKICSFEPGYLENGSIYG